MIGVWSRVNGLGNLTQQVAHAPGSGVWVSTVRLGEGHTVEQVARDGVTIRRFECTCGQERVAAIRFAVAMAKAPRVSR